jgi:hypothetical protein
MKGLAADGQRVVWSENDLVLSTKGVAASKSESIPTVSPLWARAWGEAQTQVNQLAVDGSGDLVGIGTIFADTGSVGGKVLAGTPGNWQTGFIAKYTGDKGDPVWSLALGGMPDCFALRSDGSIVVEANLVATALSSTGASLWQHPAGQWTACTAASAGEVDAVDGSTFVRLDSNGTEIGRQVIGDTSEAGLLVARGVVRASDGTFWLVGSLSGIVTVGSTRMDASRDVISVLVHLAADGSVADVVPLKGLDAAAPLITHDGAVLVSGIATLTMDVGRGEEIVPSPNRTNHCLVRYESSTTPAWVKCMEIQDPAFTTEFVSAPVEGADGTLWFAFRGYPAIDVDCRSVEDTTNYTYVLRRHADGSFYDLRGFSLVQDAGFSPASGSSGVFFAIGGTDPNATGAIHFLKLE